MIESNLSLYGIPNQFDDFAKISTSVQDYPPSIVAYTMLILSLDSAALKTIKTRSKDENQLALAKINNRVRKIRGYPEFIAWAGPDHTQSIK